MSIKRLRNYLKYLVEPPLWKLPYKLRYQFYLRLNPYTPWLTQKSIKILNQYLNKDMKTFEWGAGRSTIYFALRVKHHTSVDNSPVWVDKVKRDLEQLQLDNVTLHFKEEDPALDPASIDWPVEYPGFQFLKKTPRKPEFFEYFSIINEFEDSSLDLVLVDGRARDACILNAINKIKPGGMLVLDNAERTEYDEAKSCLSEWDHIETSNKLWKTELWIRPKT